MGKLILIRHGESTWNKLNKFTGQEDVPLTKPGIKEANNIKEKLKNAKIDYVFCSPLQRTIDTAKIAFPNNFKNKTFSIEESLKERDYGLLTGQNKKKAKEKYGKGIVKYWRRSFNLRPPNGENLKDVSDRLIPLFYSKINSLLKLDRNVVIVSHGNVIRTILVLLKIETPQSILSKSISTGEILIFNISSIS